MTTPTAQSKPMGWLVLPCRVVLAGLFIFAAYVKLTEPQAFAFSIAAFKIIPESSNHLAVLATFAIPWLELLAGLFLLLGFWARGAAMVLSLLLIAFIVGIGSVMYREMDVSCGCFGKFEWPCKGKMGSCQLIRDVVMLAMAGVVLKWGPGPLAIDRESSK